MVQIERTTIWMLIQHNFINGIGRQLIYFAINIGFPYVILIKRSVNFFFIDTLYKFVIVISFSMKHITKI